VAFDQTLAERVRRHVSAVDGLVEKRMFGGLAFLVHGNMSVGVHGSELIVRIDAAETDAACRKAGVRVFDITGRPMKGWLLVSANAVANEKTLGSWVKKGIALARSLPRK
jgi:TfoX/Sxy family transcriptional regulator of competence genes